MNELPFFGILCMQLIRFFGLLIALDYWLKRKSQSHLLYLLALGSWVIAGILPIINDSIHDHLLSELLRVSNAGISAMGFVLFMSGFLSYYQLINRKLITIFSLISFITPGLISVGQTNRIFYIFLLLQYCILLGLITMGIFYRKTIQIQSKTGMTWYYILNINYIISLAIIVYIVSLGESYGLYYSTNTPLIILNYIFAISLSLIVVLFMVQLENDQNNFLMLELKDKYSHNLGNIIQKILSATEIIEISKDEKQEFLTVIKNESNKAGNLIAEIRNLKTK